MKLIGILLAAAAVYVYLNQEGAIADAIAENKKKQAQRRAAGELPAYHWGNERGGTKYRQMWEL